MAAEIDSELNQWVEMLRSPDPRDRLVAVKTLQHLGDEAALEPLIMALEDERFTMPSVYPTFCPSSVPKMPNCAKQPS